MIIFKPTACFDKEKDGKKIKAKFKGTIEIDPPDFDQRYDYVDESGFDLNQSDDPSKEEFKSQFKAIRKLVGFSAEHISKINLKNFETGAEYKSLEDLKSDSACDAILLEIGTKMATGFGLGKKKGSESRPKQKQASEEAG